MRPYYWAPLQMFTASPYEGSKGYKVPEVLTASFYRSSTGYWRVRRLPAVRPASADPNHPWNATEPNAWNSWNPGTFGTLFSRHPGRHRSLILNNGGLDRIDEDCRQDAPSTPRSSRHPPGIGRSHQAGGNDRSSRRRSERLQTRSRSCWPGARKTSRPASTPATSGAASPRSVEGRARNAGPRWPSRRRRGRPETTSPRSARRESRTRGRLTALAASAVTCAIASRVGVIAAHVVALSKQIDQIAAAAAPGVEDTLARARCARAAVDRRRRCRCCRTDPAGSSRKTLRRPDVLADRAHVPEAERAVHAEARRRRVQDGHAVAKRPRLAHRRRGDEAAEPATTEFRQGRDVVDAGDAGAKEQRTGRRRLAVQRARK